MAITVDAPERTEPVDLHPRAPSVRLGGLLDVDSPVAPPAAAVIEPVDTRNQLTRASAETPRGRGRHGNIPL
ncbi:hypothetical protein [Micromonospora sp. NPDC092111]|uniref:hypothetical protein n=1 Tax=Micromonospora sp. NPDC092111 TaxID=3364289 RepID=UPI0037F66AAB